MTYTTTFPSQLKRKCVSTLSDIFFRFMHYFIFYQFLVKFHYFPICSFWLLMHTYLTFLKGNEIEVSQTAGFTICFLFPFRRFLFVCTRWHFRLIAWRRDKTVSLYHFSWACFFTQSPKKKTHKLNIQCRNVSCRPNGIKKLVEKETNLSAHKKCYMCLECPPSSTQ